MTKQDGAALAGTRCHAGDTIADVREQLADRPRRTLVHAKDSKNITVVRVVASGFEQLLESERSDNIRFGTAHLTTPESSKDSDESRSRRWYERPIGKWAAGIVGMVIASLIV